MKRKLLIVSCSQRKHKVEGKVRAWDLYDGVNFRVLKKIEREQGLPPSLDILILSAKYGLIRPEDMIEWYDLRMTRDQASLLRPSNQAKLLKLLSTKSYDEVLLNVGRDYLLAMDGLNSYFDGKLDIIIPQGGIGKKMSEMKKWVLSQL